MNSNSSSVSDKPSHNQNHKILKNTEKYHYPASNLNPKFISKYEERLWKRKIFFNSFQNSPIFTTNT